MNEAEDDDVDVYDSTTHVDRTYMPYDAIRDADDGSSVKRGKLVQKVVRITFLSTPWTDYFQTSTTQQQFPNGIALLAGFILPPDPVQKEQW